MSTLHLYTLTPLSISKKPLFSSSKTPFAITLKNPSSISFRTPKRLTITAKPNGSNDSADPTDRIISALCYFYPFFDGIQYGKYVLTQFYPVQAFIQPLVPAIRVFKSFPFNGFLVFVTLYFVVATHTLLDKCSSSCQQYLLHHGMHLQKVGLLLSGVCLSALEFRRPQISALNSDNLKLKFGLEKLLIGGPRTSRTISCSSQRPIQDPSSKKPGSYRQNADLPPILPKKQKKPFPVPFRKIQLAARKERKLAQMGIEKPLEPPKNGLLVPDLIPVAYEVLDAWKVLIKGVARLLHAIPVYACSECSEVHVAQTGHDIQNCQGTTNSRRHSFHSWIKGSINDIIVPIDSYHLYDPFGKRIIHETRFEYDRIPAVVELCIQAGVDMPEYPSRRRRNPVRMLGKKVIDRGGFVEEPKPWRNANPSVLIDIDTYGVCERVPPPAAEDIPRIAQETIDAYDFVRSGVRKLMRKYMVKACGYCSEVHVGPWGHNVKLCGEFKHQWRDGKHGWQDATPDEVFPPNFVWHVKDPKGPPLRSALKRFCGKAPAVVEMCMQGGAEVPDKYKPMMRLDIIVPDSEEAQLVA